MPAAAGPGSPAFLRRAPTPPADVGRSAAAVTAGAAVQHQEEASKSTEVQPHAEASPRVFPFSQLHLRRFERDGDRLVISSLRLFLGFHFGSSSPDSYRNPFWLLSTTQREGRLPHSCSHLHHREESIHSKLKPLGHDTTGEAVASFHPHASLYIAASLKISASAFDPGLSVTVCFVGEMWQCWSLSKTNTVTQGGSQLRTANAKYQPGFETQVQNPLYKR